MADNPIEGKVFCVAGIVTHYHSHDEAHAAIEAAGGKISKSIGARTDVLVLGTNTWSQEQKAKTRGIPIITERQLVRLLAGEDVNIERQAKKVGSASLEKLIGDARSTLDGHPTQTMWENVLRLADACAPDDLPALVDFLAPQVARWELQARQYWKVEKYTYGCTNAPQRWYQFMPPGELRVAPHTWTVEMAAGNDSPKFALAHAIHTRDMDLNGTMFGKLLGCASLTHLEDLDLDENKVSKTFWKKLRTAPSTRTLERFRFSRLDAKTAAGIHGAHHLESLRTLTYQTHYTVKDEVLHDFLRADAWANVETFRIQSYDFRPALVGIEGPEVLPNLKALRLTGRGEYIKEALTYPAVARAERVELDFEGWGWFIRGLGEATSATTSVRHLDLSGVRGFNHNHPGTPGKAAEFAETLRAWTPPEGLEKLTLGHWYTEELGAELSEKHGLTVAD